MSRSEAIREQFEQMGVRVEIDSNHWHLIQLNVARDMRGDRFTLRHHPGVQVRVLDVNAKDRHLVLQARQLATSEEQTFLCGHDEHAWFVAAIPETAQAETVQEAKDALKPPEVWESIRENDLPLSQRDTRHNVAFLRQGEWFFLPRPWLEVDDALTLRDEPIRRGRGKPHLCEYLYRIGGVEVFVCNAYPNGITADERRKLGRKERKRYRWTVMQRDARVYVKGAIRHEDHDTITLSYWHQVVMNTETKAVAMRNVAFLD
jgi:hypothetical protein